MRALIKNSDEQTFAEEIANAMTHGLGMLLAVVALVAMLICSARIGSLRAEISSAIFGSALILLYFSSTLYHAVWHLKTKKVLQMLDHMMIYILIAGTYTPFTLVALGGGWGWSLFGIAWGLALIGIVFKLFFTGRFEKLSVGIYLGMGWLAVIAIKPFLHAIPIAGLLWIVSGGLCYTFGVVFYAYDRIRYAHTVWHLFVLAGSLCHVVATLFYVLPKK